MTRRAYVTKDYSDFNDHQGLEGGYTYGPEQNVKWYMVDTTTVERVRVPSSGYTSVGGVPLKHGLLKEYMPKYISKGYDEGYETYRGIDYEHASPPRYYEDDELMADFLNKIQIEASRPAITYRPTSPKKYHPTSSYKHRPTSPNKYRPTSPDKKRITNPKDYRLISPNKYHLTSPTHNYPSKEAHPRAQTFPYTNKYRTISPNRYQAASPSKNMPTSLMKYRPTSPNKYRPTSPEKYQPTSPNKYRSSSPSKHQHTSPIHNYPSEEAYLRAQTYPESNNYQPTSPNKYRPTSPNKYLPTSATKYHPTSHSHRNSSKEDNPIRAQNFLRPKKYQPTSPNYSLSSREGQPIRTQNLSSPDKHHASSPITGGRHIRPGSFSGQTDHWRSGGLPTTSHHLTSPTNDINEAIGFLAESMNYTTWSNPRAQPFEHERRYPSPTFGGVTPQSYVRSSTIDSQEAIRMYNGAYVP